MFRPGRFEVLGEWSKVSKSLSGIKKKEKDGGWMIENLNPRGEPDTPAVPKGTVADTCLVMYFWQAPSQKSCSTGCIGKIDQVSVECAFGMDATLLYLFRILVPIAFVVLVFFLLSVTRVVAHGKFWDGRGTLGNPGIPWKVLGAPGTQDPWEEPPWNPRDPRGHPLGNSKEHLP